MNQRDPNPGGGVWTGDFVERLGHTSPASSSDDLTRRQNERIDELMARLTCPRCGSMHRSTMGRPFAGANPGDYILLGRCECPPTA
jgi:hypothetical protein